MVGLYETAIDDLCVAPDRRASGAAEDRRLDRHGAPRRGRRSRRCSRGAHDAGLPAAGPRPRDSFFARPCRRPRSRPGSTSASPRQGRTRRSSCCAPGSRCWAPRSAPTAKAADTGPDESRRPVYDAARLLQRLRELGGARRIVEDEVRPAHGLRRAQAVGEDAGRSSPTARPSREVLGADLARAHRQGGRGAARGSDAPFHRDRQARRRARSRRT